MHLCLNDDNRSVLAFPLKNFIYIALSYHVDNIPQVETFKYLGVIYHDSLSWKAHIDYIAEKCSGTVDLLRRLSNS